MAGDMTIMNSERLKSLKSLLCCFCVPRGANASMRAMACTANGISEFQLKIGADLYPQQSIRGGPSKFQNAEFILESLKAVGEYSNINNSGCLNADSFECSGNTLNNCGKSVYGLDLDAFSTSDAIEAGCNTVINSPISIISKSNDTDCNIYVFLMHDSILSILPSGITTISK